MIEKTLGLTDVQAATGVIAYSRVATRFNKLAEFKHHADFRFQLPKRLFILDDRNRPPSNRIPSGETSQLRWIGMEIRLKTSPRHERVRAMRLYSESNDKRFV